MLIDGVFSDDYAAKGSSDTNKVGTNKVKLEDVNGTTKKVVQKADTDNFVQEADVTDSSNNVGNGNNSGKGTTGKCTLTNDIDAESKNVKDANNSGKETTGKITTRWQNLQQKHNLEQLKLENDLLTERYFAAKHELEALPDDLALQKSVAKFNATPRVYNDVSYDGDYFANLVNKRKLSLANEMAELLKKIGGDIKK